MARILITGSEGFIGSHLVKAMEGHEVVECDVHTKEIGGPFDGIIHLAAISRVSEAESNRIKCLETNILFTAQLLEFRPSWFILVSTEEFPANIYGLSKRFAEDYCSLMGRLFGIRVGILRFPVVYGYGDNPKKLIPSIRNGGKLKQGVLPITVISVEDAVNEIADCMVALEARQVINTEEELRYVANSY